MTLEVLSPPKPRQTLVRASILFLEPSRRKPRLGFSYDAGDAEVSEIYAPHPILVRDARGAGATLDQEGFTLRRHASAVSDFSDEREAAAFGRSEAVHLVAHTTGASRVHVFDHTVRRRAPDAARQPSTRAHVDYTAASAPQRLRALLGPESDALARRRYAFINVWRPIRHPAQDWPLALCDARSVDPADLVATDIVYPDRTGEIYGLAHNPRQLWSYYPDMALDEALLIKCYDSRDDVARFAPHTAFASPATPPGAPPRESIEFRTIAFFD
jgi:hypothetical protein